MEGTHFVWHNNRCFTVLVFLSILYEGKKKFVQRWRCQHCYDLIISAVFYTFSAFLLFRGPSIIHWRIEFQLESFKDTLKKISLYRQVTIMRMTFFQLSRVGKYVYTIFTKWFKHGRGRWWLKYFVKKINSKFL